MSIEFSAEGWARVRASAQAWWRGELDRPLVQVRLPREPDRPPPQLPADLYSPQAMYDLEVPIDQVVDRWDYLLARERYLGDGYPYVHPNMGPGALAAFLGARPQVGARTVWFQAPDPGDIADLRLRFDPDTVWFQRLLAFCEEAAKRWEGRVLVATPDLGGNLDVVQSFRPGPQLFLDLIDTPEEVERLVWEVYEAWWQAFDAIREALQPANPGYSAWCKMYSETPYYILQCDASAMISPDMFARFALPEIEASARRLDNPFYHLDGVDALPNLDALLGIDALKGVQWVPGAGQPERDQWPEVYRKIRAAGKLSQLSGRCAYLDAVRAQLGSGRGFVLFADDLTDEHEARAFLDRHQVPA